VWREGLPVAIDHIITKAMAKEPMQRYRQPVAFAQAYHQIVAPREPYSPLIALSTAAPLPLQMQPFPQTSASLKPVKAKRKWRLFPRRRLITLLTISGGVLMVGGLTVVGAELLQRNSTAGRKNVSNTQKTLSTASTAAQNQAGGNRTTLVQRGEVPLNSAKTFPIANQSNPGVLIHLPDNQFVAFDTTCTHAGCEVKYDPLDSLLKCPCHEAVFNPAQHAAVVQGPAQTPLAPIKITVNADGTLVV
jgi:Rieske Fe-S protein